MHQQAQVGFQNIAVGDAADAYWEFALKFKLALSDPYATCRVDFGVLPCGNLLLLPAYELEGWTPPPPAKFIDKDVPLRHAAKRRRMKTVMWELMFKAGRMIKHAGRWILGLEAKHDARTVFERLYRQLAPQQKTSTA